MNKRAGLFLSAIVLGAVLVFGIFLGFKLSDSFSGLENENEQLKSEIEDLRSQLDGEENLESECGSAGGETYVDGNGMTLCRKPTSDGGKECTDSEECESECLAPEGAEVGTETSGTCSNSTINYGYFVESGKVEGPVVD